VAITSTGIPGASSASRATDVTDVVIQAPHVPWQEAVIERIEPQTARVKSFFLRPQSWRSFWAGQHLDVRLTAPDGYQAQRSYSVASAPGLEGLYELVVEHLEDGEVSPFFHDVAEVGDAIEIRGPFGGHFVWGPEDGGPLLLVGGGSGVAPLMSILRHRAVVDSDVRVVLLHAARAWDDVIYREELIARDAAEAEFTLLLSLSRDTARRPQDAGRRIDKPLLEATLARLGAAPRLTFVCGSNPFVEAVSSYLLDLSVSPQTIRTERFGG
jgi:ferredoxin-NADP reductase